eukprot:gnl/TRDRNA2_/TRDRNA2_175849_c4_seq3.p2 gnl/TRDRNA2_/TRDRNA2_175849_c4~~gnl/TRDRNA2_/TRDRNA2_175849_c4_seq3.p2  ORF type:complete len:105 (-),score=11.43 gnl/TRDRNA2_/TRDRNA2_175849_c4_seq3:88-402(-)
MTIIIDEATAREAATMPLTNTSNSGKDRNRRTKRERRIKRSNRSGAVGSPKPPEPSPASTTNEVTQVSPTINATKKESNLNQASRKQFTLWRKDMKRTIHSNTK